MRTSWKSKRFFYGLAAILFLSVAAQAQPVTARRPLRPPLFSWDLASPSLPLLGFQASDVLQVPGPTIRYNAVDLGENSPLDDLDGLSGNYGMLGFADKFVITFSVDRLSIGAVPPDPILVGLGLPFNVQDQAAKQQAAGDEFMTLREFTRFGPVSPFTPFADNNTLVRNQRDAGGVDYGGLPDLTPNDVNFGEPQDELQDGAYTGPLPRVPGQEFIFYSLTSGSPSLNTLPGTISGADIYVDTNPNAPGGEQLYAAPLQIGLQTNDEIDAIIIFDDGDLIFEPGIDQIIFSLARGSPSLGGFFSPADLLVSFGFGVFNLYAPANVLGLLFNDDVDMLDLAQCDDAFLCAQDWAIGFNRRHLADLNCDGVVDFFDIDAFILAISDSAAYAVLYPECNLFNADIDGNGEVDYFDIDQFIICMIEGGC